MGKTVTGGFALVLLAGGLSVATAQPQGRGQRSTPQEVQRGITVETRPRPDYDPLGVRLGGFRLDGFVEAGMGYDSNIFATKDNVKSDGYAQESGTVQLSSDWTRHAVGASAIIDLRQYLSRSDLNWTDWNVGGFGRYDIDPRSNVDFRYRHYQEHLDVYNFDVQSAGISKPVPFDSDEVQVSGSTRFNRLGLTAIGLYRTFRFEDTDIGGVRQLDLGRNFDTVIGTLGGELRLHSGPLRDRHGAVAGHRLREEHLPRAATASPGRRCSASNTTSTASGPDASAVGWQQRDYNGPQIKTLEGPAVEGRLSWSPTQLTTVTFNVSRTHRGVDPAGRVSYLRTSAGVAGGPRVPAQRPPRRRDSVPTAASTSQPSDQRHGWRGPAQQPVASNRSLSLVGTYAYTRRLEATGRCRRPTTATSSSCGCGLPSDGSAGGVAPVRLLGVEFAGLGPDEVLERLAARPPAAPFAYVVTPNADHLNRLSVQAGTPAAVRRRGAPAARQPGGGAAGAAVRPAGAAGGDGQRPHRVPVRPDHRAGGPGRGPRRLGRDRRRAARPLRADAPRPPQPAHGVRPRPGGAGGGDPLPGGPSGAVLPFSRSVRRGRRSSRRRWSGAARPRALVCASARASSSSPAPSAARRGPSRAQGWNGPGGWSRTRGAWRGATSWTAPGSSASFGAKPGAAARAPLPDALELRRRPASSRLPSPGGCYVITSCPGSPPTLWRFPPAPAPDWRWRRWWRPAFGRASLGRCCRREPRRDPPVRPHGLPCEAAGGASPLGTLRAGQPDRRGRAERGREVHAAPRPRRPASAAGRADRRRRARGAAAAAIGGGSQLSAVLPRRGAVRPVGGSGAVPRHEAGRAGARGSGARRGGAPRLRASAGRQPCRPASSSACSSRGCCCRTRP